MNQPKISVIIPVYNAEKYLEECLDSVLGQTLKDIEVICVDDGSTDDSLSILETYTGKHNNLVILKQKNTGVAFARNRAIKAAHGEYVCFLDADDYYPSSDTLRLLYNKAKTNGALICGGAFSSFRNDGYINTIWPKNLSGYTFDHEGFIDYKDYQFDFGYHRFLYNRRFLIKNGLFFPPYKRYQDPPFFVKAMVTAKRFYAVTEVVYRYRTGHQVDPMTWSLEKLHDMMRGCLDNLNISRERHLAHLHFLTLQRVENYRERHVMVARVLEGDSEGLNLLCAINNAIDVKLLVQEGISLNGENNYVLKQMMDIINVQSSKEEELESLKSSYLKKYELMKKAHVKVSIVIPSLNSIAFIGHCIRSVVNQTLRDIEVICVDAGSTDGTLDVLENFSKFDPRIRILHSDKKSYGYQMNLGFSSARGEYIGIVESDDYVEPDMFEKLYHAAKADDLDLAKSGFFNHYTNPDGSGRDVPAKIPSNAPKDVFCPLTSSFTESSQFFSMSPSIWTGLYRADFIREKHILFTETPGASYQDTAFTFKVWCCAARARFVDACLLHYRRDNDNSSSNSRGKVYCVVDEYNEEERFLSEEQPQVKERAEGIRCRLKYGAYLWNYRRLGMPEKLEFLKYAAEEFAGDREKGYLVRKYFSTYQWDELGCLIDDYRAFHAVNGFKWKNEDKIAIMRNIAAFHRKHLQDSREKSFRPVYVGKKETPLVSVIIPVYNTAAYVGECLESICRQTIDDIEIICINDGSTDNSLDVLLRYAANDDRIYVYTQDNGGQGAARNRGLSVARGDFIYFMDSDDLLRREALSELVDRMKKDDLDIVYFDADSFGDGANESTIKWYRTYYHRKQTYEGVFTGRDLMDRMVDNNEYRVSPCLQMIRKSFLIWKGLSFPEGIIYEDNAFNFKAMLQAERVGYMPKSFYDRRVRDGSTMTRKVSFDNAYGYFRCYEIMMDFIERHGNWNFSKEAFIVLSSVFHNGRNAYASLPWVERKSIMALSLVEETAMSLYYEDWGVIRWQKELEKRKIVSAGGSFNTTAAVTGTVEDIPYERLQYDFDCMRNSVSFRVGRTITWGPRKVRGAYRCLMQHGMIYTLKRCIEHMGVDMGTGDFKKSKINNQKRTGGGRQ